MEEPIDVVIPVFNGMPYVKQAVESCLSQVGVALRVTIVDNASTDGTWELLQRMSAMDNRLNILRNDSNVGMVANIKKCFNNVSAPRFCFLCADDKLLNAKSLVKASAILDAHPEVGVVYCDMHYIGSNDRLLLVRKFNRDGVFSAIDVGRQSVLEGRNLFGIPLLTNSSLLAKVCFDESLTYAGDVDLALQLGMHTKSWHLPDFLIANRYHRKNATRSLQRQAYCQFITIAEKHGLTLTGSSKLQMRIATRKNAILRSLFLTYADMKNCLNHSD